MLFSMENQKKFRIPVIVKKNTVETGRYLILVTCTESGKVRELQDHIRNVFNITGQVNLKVENFILPENESIHVVHPEDIVEVELVEADDRIQDEYKETVRKVKSERKKKVEGVGTVLNRLIEEKKTELLSTLESVDRALPEEREPIPGFDKLNCSTSNDIITTQDHFDDSSYACENDSQAEEKMIVKRKFNEVGTGREQEFTSPADENDIRRRKRTRKKKKSSLGDLPSKDESLETNVSMCSETVSKPINRSESGKSTKKHIYFNNDGEPNLEPEMNDAPVEEAPVDTNDWQTHLLQLASLPREKKVFQRSLEPNEKLEKSVNFNFSDLKSGTVLIFKILVVENSCPVISSEIVGEVITIDVADESISLKIIKNHEALMEVDETSFSGDELCIRWDRMIEPHL